jgi:hypothetical protein
MRSSAFLCLAIVLTAGLCAAPSAARAAHVSLVPQDHSVPRLLLPATTKCITVNGRKFCKDFGHKNKDKDTTPADSKSGAPVSKCALGTHSDGQCVCPKGQVNHADGSCGRPCGYGMSGVPPKCKCVTGATLHVTGPTTKGCVCPDGNPPKDVDGNYACQNLGPQ